MTVDGILMDLKTKTPRCLHDLEELPNIYIYIYIVRRNRTSSDLQVYLRMSPLAEDVTVTCRMSHVFE